MKSQSIHATLKCIIAFLAFAALIERLQAIIVIEDTFTRSGGLNNSTADSGQTWSGSGWTTDGEELDISGSTSSLISGLTFLPNTTYTLTMDVNITAGGSLGGNGWIGFGFTRAGGNSALLSRGFMLHKFDPLIEFFSTGLSGIQTFVPTSPLPNTLEIELTTGATLSNSTLRYSFNGNAVGSPASTDASTLDSVFIQNINDSVGTVDNFRLRQGQLVRTNTFLEGTPNEFHIDFVEVGDAGNPSDSGIGGVAHDYYIGKYEVQEQQIHAYNLVHQGSPLEISLDSRGVNKPATRVSWNEAARFVNWLNSLEGFPDAYKFTTDGANDNISLWTTGDPGFDSSNPYRNSNARYVLPSMDEWYKAAYYNGCTASYFLHATGNNTAPTSVVSGTDYDTAVFSLAWEVGPADTTEAGGLSPYGTMAQGGNILEWCETAVFPPNDSATEQRRAVGGLWNSNAATISNNYVSQRSPSENRSWIGFRVASLLRPEIVVEQPLTNGLVNGSSTLNLGSALVDGGSATKTVTVCNSGNATLTSLLVTLSGADATNYSVNTDLNGVNLAPNQCTTIDITYSPSGEGNHTATLNIESNDADESPFIINLTGTGLTPYLIAQQACLTGNAPDAGDEFGYSVAISEDGSTVVVGAYNEDSAAAGIDGDQADNSLTDSGAVYVYHRSAGVWSQQAYLKASNPDASDAFGWSVDISGETIVVGAFREEGGIAGINTAGAGSDNSASLAGAAYVFQRNGTSWSEQAYLKSPDPDSGDRFGYSVSISGDRIAVGAPLEDGSSNDPADNSSGNSGAVYLFKRLVGVWTTDAYLKASNLGLGDQFGHSVSLDSNLLVVGSPYEDSDLNFVDGNGSDNSALEAGAAYIFEDNGGWGEIAYLKANNSDAGDLFGWSVAIASDSVLVGSPDEDSNATGVDGDGTNNSAIDAGAAYVFRPSGQVWAQTSYLKPATMDAGDRYGVWVTMTKTTLAVGASLEDSSSVNVNGDESDNGVNASGSVRVYISSGGSWIEKSYLKASEVGSFYTFGQALAISDFGMVVGSRGVRSGPGATPSGAAYIYDLLPEIKVEEPVNNDLTNGLATLDLGAGIVGSPALTKTITICNEGFGLLSGLSVSLSGPHPGDFMVDSSLLGSQLSPCACRTITVSFTPTEDGARTATLSIASSDLDENPFEINLTGIGFVPPEIAQETYFKASNTGNGDQYGCSVSVWENTVAIGAYSEDSDAIGINQDMNNNNTAGSGAVYIYVRNPDNCEWSLQATLKSSNPDLGDSFGGKLSLFGDTLAVGALSEDSSATDINGDQANNSSENSGAVYVFVRNGTTWTQQAYLKASNTGEGDRFGEELSLSGDTLVVGAAWEDSSATGVNGAQGDDIIGNNAQGLSSGAAYVFVRNSGSWTQEAYLKASNTARGDLFGDSVAVSGDTIIVGASGENSEDPGANGINGDFGAAYVFVRTSGNWSQQAFLKASNKGPADRFGTEVALEGDTAVVCAPYQGDSSVAKAGAAYVFTRDNANNWTEQTYLKASNPGEGDRFGWSASLSGDLLLIGSPYEESQSVGVNGGNQTDDSLAQAGASYLFRNLAGTWVQEAFLKASNTGEDDEFGWSVDLYGSTIFVGAKGEKSNATGINSNQSNNSLTVAGAAYLFENPSKTSIALAQYDAATAQAGLVGADAQVAAIPFGDGISNLVKYAFNLNLAGADSHTMSLGGNSGLPWGEIVEINGQSFWQFEYLIRKECALVYTPQKSATLLPNSFLPFTGDVTISDIDSNWSRGTILEPYDPTSQPECFYRVQLDFP